jgi:hypothetical protein
MGQLSLMIVLYNLKFLFFFAFAYSCLQFTHSCVCYRIF